MARRRSTLALLALAVVAFGLDVLLARRALVETDGGFQLSETVELPAPRTAGPVSVEETLAARRSRRSFGPGPLARWELGQLLWAAQGVTDPGRGFRAAPSAGARYPLELFVVVGESGVEGLEAGIYRYEPERHALSMGARGDVRTPLQAAALDQESVGGAPVDVLVMGVDERTTARYGERGARRYVPMEAGHAGENLSLQAESLGLATVSIGAFDDDRVRELVGAPATYRSLYVFPVGRRR